MSFVCMMMTCVGVAPPRPNATIRAIVASLMAWSIKGCEALREGLKMRVLLVIIFLSGAARAEPRLGLAPPAGSTFAPGQRFDIRLEANDIRGMPQSYSIFINGREVTREVFGPARFETFPLLDAAGNPGPLLGGGITGR